VVVIIKHFFRRVARRVSDNSLMVLGEPRLLTNNISAIAVAANSLSLDIPSGPLPGTYWVLEYVAAILADPTAAGVPDSVLSGFCIVQAQPAAQASVADPPNTGTATADINDRGIFLLPNFASEQSAGTRTYMVMSLVGLKIVIPYGYTIRAVATSTFAAATPFGIGTFMNMGCLVRVISSCNPCPPVPQIPL
jgi:hypothetical protein